MFTATVTFSEYGPLGTKVVVLYGCTITNVEDGGAEGSDALEVKVDFDIMKIKRNGLNPMRNMV